MADALKLTTALGMLSLRSDFEALVTKALPDTAMADGVKLQVVNDAVTTKNAVPGWEKYEIGYATVAALGAVLSGQVDILTLPDGAVVHAVKVMSSVQWAGTAVATLVGDVGNAGTPAKYLTGYNMLAAPADNNIGVGLTPGYEAHTLTGAGAGTALKLRVTATGANLSALTAGTIRVWVLWSATDVA
jgi:hypothetical protein